MPVRTTPLPKRPDKFDQAELQAVAAALDKNELWYWQEGSVVAEALRKAAARFQAPYAVATSSGTASIHVAVAAARLQPATEVITSPITDIGTINPILYQNLIPVFADVDPDTGMPTPEHIEAAITERTGAVLIVHLTGCPADLEPIARLCADRNLVLIEDCAQGLGATYQEKSIGTFGRFGCFSLNDQKHITSGEGGFVLVQNEEDFYLCHNYADKYYDRHKKGVRLEALAPNYRMSEIDGALFGVQLDKLDRIVAARVKLGEDLSHRVAQIPGLIPQPRPNKSVATYFFLLLRIDTDVLTCTRDQFLADINAEGLSARAAYVPVPIYRSPYFRNKSFFPGGIWPAEIVSGLTYDYTAIDLPGAELAVGTGITLTLHEGFTAADIDDYVEGLTLVADRYRK